jgi:hypothetical protein
MKLGLPDRLHRLGRRPGGGRRIRNSCNHAGNVLDVHCIQKRGRAGGAGGSTFNEEILGSLDFTG